MNLVKYTLILALLGSFSSTAFGMEKKRSGEEISPEEGWKYPRKEIKKEYKDDDRFFYPYREEESTQAFPQDGSALGDEETIEPEVQATNDIDIDIAIPDVDTSSNNNALPKINETKQDSVASTNINELIEEMGNLREFVEKKFTTTRKILQTITERIREANNQIDIMANDVAALKALQPKLQPMPLASNLKPAPKKAADKVQMIMVPGQKPGMTKYVPSTAAEPRELQWVQYPQSGAAQYIPLIPIEAASTYYPHKDHLPQSINPASAQKPAAPASKPAAPQEAPNLPRPVAKPAAQSFLPFDQIIPGYRSTHRSDTLIECAEKIEANNRVIFNWLSDLSKEKRPFPTEKIAWFSPLQIYPIQTAYNGGNLDEATRLIQSHIKRTFMGYAIARGTINMINAILASGYDLNEPVTYDSPRTPLMFAAESEREEIVEILLKAGAQVNYQKPFTNATALHLACCSKNDDPTITID